MTEPSLIHPTIYKRTSTGAIQTWWIEQDGAAYRVATGQIDGAITRSTYKQAVGKNQGRSNETTPEAQAATEVASEYKKKLAQGRYCELIEDVDQKKYTAPMLAHKWEDHPNHHPTPEEYAAGKVFSQRKLDGVRCIAQADGLWTRKGKPIVAVPHIWESLKPLFVAKPNLVLDGELYTHELRQYLNRISGIVRKTKFTDEELELARTMQYHIYDNIPGDETAPIWDVNQHGPFHTQTEVHPEAGFQERHAFLVISDLVKDFWTDFTDTGKVDATGNIHWLEMTQVMDEEHCDRLLEQHLADEYEGEMVRKDGEPYEHKRSYKLMKRKKGDEAEFTITGFSEGVGNRSGMAGNVNYITADGIEFNSGIAGGVEFYKHLWANQELYTGGQGTVRFFGYSEYGKPIQAVTHAVFEGERDV